MTPEQIADVIKAEMKYAVHLNKDCVTTLKLTANRFVARLSSDPDFDAKAFLIRCGF